jgi:hypothetical protein
MSNYLNHGRLNHGRLKRGRLKRGLALLATRDPGVYLIGDRTASIRLNSRVELTAAHELASGVFGPSNQDLETKAIERICNSGFTSQSQPLPALPRRYGVLPTARDVAMQLIIKRSAPELAECEWAQRDDDGGATTLALRSSARILISGRSRIATLLLHLLPQSGVGSVESADRYESPEISPMDIGMADIAMADIGGNFYQRQSARNISLALFSAKAGQSEGNINEALDRTLESERPTTHQQPTLIIHCGDLGIEDQVDWLVSSQPHLIITKPLGREVAISPIILPGQSPCLRCMELYELDRYGFSRFERIPLTQIDESSVVASHFIASLVASMALNFIDSNILTAQGVGEITYIDRLDLRAPQVVAIERHPLCGCSAGFLQ